MASEGPSGYMVIDTSNVSLKVLKVHHQLIHLTLCTLWLVVSTAGAHTAFYLHFEFSHLIHSERCFDRSLL